MKEKELLLEFLSANEMYFSEKELKKFCTNFLVQEHKYNTKTGKMEIQAFNWEMEYLNDKAIGFLPNPSVEHKNTGIYVFVLRADFIGNKMGFYYNAQSYSPEDKFFLFNLASKLCNRLIVHTYKFAKITSNHSLSVSSTITIKEKNNFFYALYMESGQVDRLSGISKVSPIVFYHMEYLSDKMKYLLKEVEKNNNDAFIINKVTKEEKALLSNIDVLI